MRIIISFCFGFWTFVLFPLYWTYEIDNGAIVLFAYGFPLPYWCDVASVLGNSGDHMFNLTYLLLDIVILWGGWFFILYLLRNKIRTYFENFKKTALGLMLLLISITSLFTVLYIYFLWFLKLGERLPWFNFNNVKIISISLWR